MTKIERSAPAGPQLPRPRLTPTAEPTLHVARDNPAPRSSERVPRVPLGTYLPEPLKRQLKAYCATENIEMQDAVAAAIELWLASKQAG